MTTCVMLMTDGRAELFSRTIASLRAAWHGRLDEIVVIDDSGDPLYARWLDEQHPTYRHVHHPERRGFGRAIASGWEHVGHHDYIFHLEDDFLFTQPINLGAMRMILDENPDVCQVALKRQSWSDRERAVGGFMELEPDEWNDEQGPGGLAWCWSRLWYTTNPSLYRGALTRRPWPDCPESEGMFGVQLKIDHPETRFGYLGAKASPPVIEHIGKERRGTGY